MSADPRLPTSVTRQNTARSRARATGAIKKEVTVATYNVNGVNGRLELLLRWLDEASPDVVVLQELKASDARFPNKQVENLCVAKDRDPDPADDTSEIDEPANTGQVQVDRSHFIKFVHEDCLVRGDQNLDRRVVLVPAEGDGHVCAYRTYR